MSADVREALPMPYPPLLAAICLAYFIGALPFGLFAGRLKGIDIRAHGSGNIGATNVWRVLGRNWGLPVFLLDVAKGLFAVLLAKWLAVHWPVTVPLAHGHTRTEYLDASVAGIAAALAVILGHNFPVWLRFRGGKGVATSLGVLFGLMPLASTLTFLVWGLTAKLTRYVSVASIMGALALPLIVLTLFLVPLPWGMRGWPYFYFSVAATLLLIVRHTANIRRLLHGTERRMGEPKPGAVPPASAASWGTGGGDESKAEADPHPSAPS